MLWTCQNNLLRVYSFNSFFVLNNNCSSSWSRTSITRIIIGNVLMTWHWTRLPTWPCSVKQPDLSLELMYLHFLFFFFFREQQTYRIQILHKVSTTIYSQIIYIIYYCFLQIIILLFLLFTLFNRSLFS